MEPLPASIRQQFIDGIFLHDKQLIASNVKYQLWSRIFWSVVLLGIVLLMIYEAITQPIWPNLTIIRDNWPSSLLLIALILGWYIGIGYLLYEAMARIVLLNGQRQERVAQARGICHYGILLTDEGLAIRLPTRPFLRKREFFWRKTAVTSASSFLKRDNRNVGHWHVRISYINEKGAETSTSFPYDEFQCRHVDQLTERMDQWLSDEFQDL